LKGSAAIGGTSLKQGLIKTSNKTKNKKEKRDEKKKRDT